MKVIALYLALAFVSMGATVARVACGGTGVVDSAGNAWTPDANFTGGARWNSDNQASMSTMPAPYGTLRYSATPPGSPFSYTFQVAPGKYTVTLKFVEPNKTGPGQRLFNVTINGTQIITNLDLFASAGALKVFDNVIPVSTADGSIQILFTSVIGNALVSGIKIDEVVTPPVDTDGVKITCESGTVKVGLDLVNDAPSQEVEVLSDIQGNWRWNQITLCPTERFLGQSKVTVSMGRSGADRNFEMTGSAVPITDLANNQGCWQLRPIPPQFTGPYEVVLNFTATTIDTSTGNEVPGNISKLSGGLMTWESCGYPAIIGAPPPVVGAMAKLASLELCSGSGPGWDCSGLYRARISLSDGTTLPLVGTSMSTGTNPATTWTPIK